jgi:hypothetical protein
MSIVANACWSPMFAEGLFRSSAATMRANGKQFGAVLHAGQPWLQLTQLSMQLAGGVPPLLRLVAASRRSCR